MINVFVSFSLKSHDVQIRVWLVNSDPSTASLIFKLNPDVQGLCFSLLAVSSKTWCVMTVDTEWQLSQIFWVLLPDFQILYDYNHLLELIHKYFLSCHFICRVRIFYIIYTLYAVTTNDIDIVTIDKVDRQEKAAAECSDPGEN